MRQLTARQDVLWALMGGAAAGLSAFLHFCSFSGGRLAGWQVWALLLAFVLTALCLLALVLRVQSELAGGARLHIALADRLPRVGRWVLGLGFVYLGLQLLDVMPGGRGQGAGFSFDRTFTAILAWQALAAALFHSRFGSQKE